MIYSRSLRMTTFFDDYDIVHMLELLIHIPGEALGAAAPEGFYVLSISFTKQARTRSISPLS